MKYMKQKINKLTAIQLFRIMLLAAVVSITFFCFSNGICGNDFWWHIKVGECICTHGKIPTSDIFSWYGIANNFPWTAHEWLSEVIYYLIFNAFGEMGMFIFSIGLAFMMEWLLYKKCKAYFERNVIISGLYFVLFAVLTSVFFYGRPHMMSFFLLYIEMDCLYTYYDDRSSKKIYLIPLIACLWSNMHGGSSNLAYILCIIFLVCGLFNFKWGCIESKRESKSYLMRMLGITIASIFAILVNPVGFKVLKYPYESMGDKFQLTVISEWAPPDAKNIGNIVLFFLPIALFLLCMFAEKKLIRMIDLMIMGIFIFLFLRSMRFIALWYIVVPFCGFRYLIPCRLKEVRNNWQKVILIVFILILLSPIPVSINSIKRTYSNGNLISKVLDKDIIEIVKHENPKRIYNDYNYGESLIYNDINVFVDARADLYSKDNLLKDAIALMKLTPTDENNIELNVEELVHKYNFDGYLIEKTRPLYIYLKSHSEKYVMVGENYEAAYFRLRP